MDILVQAVKVGFFQGLRTPNDVFSIPEKEFDDKSEWYVRHEPVVENEAVKDVHFGQSALPNSAVAAMQVGQAQNIGTKPANYAKMNKTELVAESVKMGLVLTGNETNPQIIEMLQAAQPKE